ncbi:MAG: PD40 domain-containing protein [Solirubrobacterales bacterium]|nr:PD40 domain-containing protein [Solirubrobacterales bacterium]
MRTSTAVVASLLTACAVFMLFAPGAAADRVIWDQSTNSVTPDSRGIFIAEPGGLGFKQLSFTSSPDWHGPPAGTPDGKQIMYTDRVSSTGVATLRLMDADGKNDKPLFEDAYDAEYSPDGSKIVFTRFVASKSIIHTISGDGKGSAASTGVEGRSPTYEPNGERIAFSASPGDGGGSEIFLMNADGSGVKQLTHTTGGSPWIDSSHPSFSPDGLEIVFSMSVSLFGLSQPPGSHLMTIDVPDPDPDPDDPDPVLTDLTAGQPNTDEHDLQPSWSPDGDQIAFFSRRQDGTTGIYVMAATVGAPATLVHDTPTTNTNPGTNWLAEPGDGDDTGSTDSAACKNAKKKLKAAQKKLRKANAALRKAKKKGASQAKIKRLKKQVKQAKKKFKQAKRKKNKVC